MDLVGRIGLARLDGWLNFAGIRLGVATDPRMEVRRGGRGCPGTFRWCSRIRVEVPVDPELVR